LRVRERTETVVVLLAGGIPELEGHPTTIDHDVGRVVVEDCIVGRGSRRRQEEEMGTRVSNADDIEGRGGIGLPVGTYSPCKSKWSIHKSNYQLEDRTYRERVGDVGDQETCLYGYIGSQTPSPA
jgi:hypothetical protein